MFRASCAIFIFSLSTLCHCVHQPHHQQFGPQRYEIEEDPAKQTVPASYHRTYPSSSRQTYDHNQLNQFYQLQQLNQLQQLQQQQQAAYAASPQTQQAAYANNPQSQQYLASLQQFYAASKQPQNAYSSAPAQAAAPQSQYVPQAAQQQQGYPAPLGVLYSAASDVSQFQFSGNGVNYSF